ncbi:probable LRR receptor-like serine/threonine-protein kinase At2g16250 [Zingiber officinale]|uniref:Protein kinase domain-containing protein n=1 Tax=Zingiber officinale TaxID=94328 RepID=A0A8J5LJ87_ZINOF|nr:probable LRR receptor-like serine/threonine-protein kinase At2g16250 [Zingiber officinale]XP_042473430.1 probable LRR receptor-like serine/threonine-protein kinase At2g16250 [Zingiber officinale]KAG6517458.1 hypothetical protein ZIOFF_020850 [Zingiber officinale]
MPFFGSPPDGNTLVMRVILIIVLWCAAAVSAATAQNLSSASDLAGLYDLRGSLGLRARDWPRLEDPCTFWVGVTCSAAGRVVGIDLSGLRRTRLGRLNPQFAVDGLRNLSSLQSFNAAGFALPGPIPDWFGRDLAPTFAVLVLRHASVQGPIPYALGDASGITVLDLVGNKITGNIPPTLGQLSNLTLLDLSSNSLSDAVPVSLGMLRNLNILILADNSLIGFIPPQLGDLTSLTVLDLSSNSLTGSLPDDFRNLGSLQNLTLSHNLLSGPLPDSLFTGLTQLQSVKLSHNNFSGPLPDSVWSLSELSTFDVSHNNFTGVLPDIIPGAVNSNVSGVLFDLSNNLYYGQFSSRFVSIFNQFRIVDLSANYLEGALSFVNISSDASLRSNCFQNATDQRSTEVCVQFYTKRGLSYIGDVAPSPAPSGTQRRRRRNRNLIYILIGAIGGSLVLITMVLLLRCCCKQSGRQKAEQQRKREITTAASGGGGILPPTVQVNLSAVGEPFTYKQLVQATSDFSEENLIRPGHSGDIFRGVLERGIPIVVKRMDLQKLKRDAPSGELDLFSKGLHERLVPFLGHCLEKENEKFLIYKFVPNGDLSSALQRKPELEEGLQSLDWLKRLKIATGIAEALNYLHNEFSPPLVHRDIQASSILLDDKFEVRLGSLSEICVQEGDAHQNVFTRLLRISQTSEHGVSGPPATCAYDVHCLGKVLLELVTGKLGISGSTDAAANDWLDHTLQYISVYEKDLVTRIVDPFLVVDEDHLEEVWAMAIVAKSCLNPKPNKRPPVRYILRALENPLKVVREDNHSGSARLRATSSRGSWTAAFMGSWRRSSSEIVSVPGQLREDQTLKRSGTCRSQGSGGEQSFSRKRPSREIFPEPSSGIRDMED